jgi:hypothetical protein
VIEIDGVKYPSWGAVEAIISWCVLVEQSGLYARFEKDGRSFSLTRTDQVFNPETGEITREWRQYNRARRERPRLNVSILLEKPRFS